MEELHQLWQCNVITEPRAQHPDKDETGQVWMKKEHEWKTEDISRTSDVILYIQIHKCTQLNKAK